MATRSTKLRLYGKSKPKVTNPLNPKKKFTLRQLDECDGRFAIVKRLRQQLAQLIEDTKCDSVQQQWLCNRAATLNAWCEAQDVKFAEENPKFNLRMYMAASKTLTEIVNKLGIENGRKTTAQLSDYLQAARKSKKKA